jgi:hypothetical protein
VRVFLCCVVLLVGAADWMAHGLLLTFWHERLQKCTVCAVLCCVVLLVCTAILDGVWPHLETFGTRSVWHAHTVLHCVELWVQRVWMALL